jgi:hypothetical protein
LRRVIYPHDTYGVRSILPIVADDTCVSGDGGTRDDHLSLGCLMAIPGSL